MARASAIDANTAEPRSDTATFDTAAAALATDDIDCSFIDVIGCKQLVRK